MNRSKAAIVMSAIIEKMQLIAGILILLVFGLCTIVALGDAELASKGFLPMCLVLDAIGILLIFLSRRRHRLIVDFKKYVSAISGDPTGSIANLAAATGTSQDVVKKNLNAMIQKKYFVNAHINYETNRIIIGNTVGNNNPQMTTTVKYTTKQVIIPGVSHPQQTSAAQPAIPKIEYVSYTCKNCGGMNRVVKGQSGECDFCGSPIN